MQLCGRGDYIVDKSIGNTVLRGTVIIVIIGILAKVAAFLSEAILAAYLGTTYQSDAYYMVSSIKDVIYPMLSVGIWKVFLPVYKEKITQNHIREADELTDKSLSFFTLASVVVVTLIIIFADVVVSIVAPGFEGETRSLCIKLVRLSSPMYVLIIASALYASMLQCHNKFLGSQIREVVTHIPTIVAAVFFYNKYGIESVAIALVAGGAIRLIVEIPFVDWGYKYKLDFRFRTIEFALILKRLPSALLSEGVTQLNTLIDKAMASTLPEGTVSGLNYGHKLMHVLSGLLSTAIATALYPQMIELIALNKKEELSKLIGKTLNVFSVLMIPITVACILYRVELVSVVFQRGSFGEYSVKITSNVFAFYCIGILFIACNAVINNLFYGLGDTKTPMYISIINLIINVVLNLVLIHIWGVNGLALATSISAILTFFIRLYLSQQYYILMKKSLLITGLKVSMASAFACCLPRFFFWYHPYNNYIVLFVSAMIGIIVYYLMVKALRVQELNDLEVLIRQKIRNH